MDQTIRYQGIFETHLPVADLERSADFYENVLGLTLAFDDPRGIRFYWVGTPRESMLGLWKTEPGRVERRHFAFRTTSEELPGVIATLRGRGVRLYDFHGNETDVPFVFGWVPAEAIYFDDPDGHWLEFLAVIPGRPMPELGVATKEAWLSASRGAD
ncbi:MAG TPA: VOC family protein [Paenibacillus sp.]|nr:VOC family protein [Paenibacillus sp.]